MTSKEAFDEIIKACNNCCHHIFKDDIEVKTICGYPIDNIRKDLEVLEILKKEMPAIRVIDACDYKSYCFFSELLSEEEFNKIKEWLNEGNNKN